MVFQRRQAEEPTDAAGFRSGETATGATGCTTAPSRTSRQPSRWSRSLVEAWYNRGCSWYEVGELENAIADLTRAIELAPTNGLYYGQRALVYHFNDQPELAEADQERCDELRFGAELDG